MYSSMLGWQNLAFWKIIVELNKLCKSYKFGIQKKMAHSASILPLNIEQILLEGALLKILKNAQQNF